MPDSPPALDLDLKGPFLSRPNCWGSPALSSGYCHGPLHRIVTDFSHPLTPHRFVTVPFEAALVARIPAMAESGDSQIAFCDSMRRAMACRQGAKQCYARARVSSW